jgi:hypothetical protein
MGMFDTIKLEKPLVCPACGHEDSTVQTHHFGQGLATYRVGMIVSDSPILTGILLETFWCSACHNADTETAPKLYVVIWHSILIAVEWQREEAECKLAAVDRLNLIEWLDQTQREALTWRRNYHALRNDLARWQEYQDEQKRSTTAEDSSTTANSPLSKLFMPDESIRNATDPLAVILERHPPDAEAEAFWTG